MISKDHVLSSYFREADTRKAVIWLTSYFSSFSKPFYKHLSSFSLLQFSPVILNLFLFLLNFHSIQPIACSAHGPFHLLSTSPSTAWVGFSYCICFTREFCPKCASCSSFCSVSLLLWFHVCLWHTHAWNFTTPLKKLKWQRPWGKLKEIMWRVVEWEGEEFSALVQFLFKQYHAKKHMKTYT